METTNSDSTSWQSNPDSPATSPSYTMTIQGKLFRPWDQHQQMPQDQVPHVTFDKFRKSSSSSKSHKSHSSKPQDMSKISLKEEVKACKYRHRLSESGIKSLPSQSTSSSNRSSGSESSSGKSSKDYSKHAPASPELKLATRSEPSSPIDADYHQTPTRSSPSNFFLYPMAINELANLSRNELTAIGLLPPEPAGLNKAKRQRPKRFHCPHCQVAFSNNGQLRGHIRIHTGERPFVCEHESCGKSFTRNEELTRHRRIHTGLRPYPCTYCGKKFGRKDHLKKHTRTHQRVMYAPPAMIGYAPFQPFHPPILSTAISPDLSLPGTSPFSFPMLPPLSTAHFPPL